MLAEPSIDHLEIAKTVANTLFLLSACGVVIGVILEGKSFSAEVNEAGWKILVVSLSLELVFTLTIFGIDEQIARTQRREIIALETRLAARTLSDSQVANIRERLKSFWPLSFQIIPYWKDKESKDIADRIAGTLGGLGWKLENPTRFTMLAGVIAGVVINIDKRASENARNAARELAAALSDNGVAAEAEEIDAGNDPISERINMQVGIKP